DEEAAAILAYSATTKINVGAVLASHVDITQHPLELYVIDDRTQFSLSVQRIPGRQRFADLPDLLQHGVLDAVLYEETRASRTHLALIFENRIRCSGSRLV